MGIIVIADSLYISNNIKNPKKVVANIIGDNFSGSEFLICLNSTSTNLMDIYYTQEIKNPYVNLNNLMVLAICAGKEETKQTCAFIIEQFMQEYNDINDFKSKVGLIRWGKND